MAIYTGNSALSAHFRPPREGSHAPQRERISMGPDPAQIADTRRSSAAPALTRSNSLRAPLGEPSIGNMAIGAINSYAGANRVNARRRARISERRRLYRELGDAHRRLSHLWAEAASRLHAGAREAYANGQPAAELDAVGRLAEAQMEAHLRAVNALRDAMRSTYASSTQKETRA